MSVIGGLLIYAVVDARRTRDWRMVVVLIIFCVGIGALFALGNGDGSGYDPGMTVGRGGLVYE